MIFSTVTGRIGKDAVTRQTAKGDSVTSFTIASDSGYGDSKTTTWVTASLWGTRGEKLCSHLVKGSQVTVVGEQTQDEYEGKAQIKLRVADIALQGGKKDEQPKPAPAPIAVEDDFDLPF